MFATIKKPDPVLILCAAVLLKAADNSHMLKKAGQRQ
jgi:hypothetical protein